MHVWVSRERAVLLERVRLSRLLHNAWDVWRARQYRINDLEGICFTCEAKAPDQIIV